MELYCVQLNNGYPRIVVGFEDAKNFGYMMVKDDLERSLKNLKTEIDKINERAFTSERIMCPQLLLTICPVDILKHTDSFQLIDVTESPKESK